MLLLNPLIAGSRRELHDHVAALAATVEWFDATVGRARQSAPARRNGSHSNIRYDIRAFIGKMRRAAAVRTALGLDAPARFLDVGCGSGAKVVLASRYFARADGLEYDENYLAVCRDLLEDGGAPGCGVIEGDALAFTRYGRYDVIYLYRPFSGDRKQRQLEERVAAQARPGAILIGVLCDFAAIAAGHGLAPIGENMFIKGVPPARLRAALRTASAVELPGDSARDRLRNEIWRELLRAAGRRGEPGPPSRQRFEETLRPARVNAAIDALQDVSPRAAEILALRLVGQASLADIAKLEKISPAVLRREWAKGLAWLAGVVFPTRRKGARRRD